MGKILTGGRKDKRAPGRLGDKRVWYVFGEWWESIFLEIESAFRNAGLEEDRKVVKPYWEGFEIKIWEFNKELVDSVKSSVSEQGKEHD